MHLVFISTLVSPPWGGSEKLWSDAASKALGEGHQVTVFVSERETTEPQLLAIKMRGAHLVFWPHVAGRPDLIQRIFSKVRRSRSVSAKWWKANLPTDADLYCINQGGVFCASHIDGLLEAVMQAGRPYVVLARSDCIPYQIDDQWRTRAKPFYERAAAYIGASESTVALARRRLVSVLPNALSLHSPISDYSDVVPGWPDGGILRMACVARLATLDKGQDLLISCLAKDVWRDRPFRLTFYGEGPDRAFLSEYATLVGIGSKVTFAGHTSHISEVWANNHLALQPSLVEGTPQSMLEAMLCRRPVVATAVGGIPEWLKEDEGGFLAESPTIHDISEALERAWESRVHLKDAGVKAREICLQKRNPDPAGTLFQLLAKAAGSAEHRGFAANVNQEAIKIAEPESTASPDRSVSVEPRDKLAGGSSLNFLFITTKVSWGGSEYLWYEAADKAIKAGYRVTIVLPRTNLIYPRLQALVALGARLVVHSPLGKWSYLHRIARKLSGSKQRETQWWQEHFSERFDAICVSQGGSYCLLQFPGLANWLSESKQPFVLLCHSNRNYIVPSADSRQALRDVFPKAFNICFDAAENARATTRFLAVGLPQSIIVQNPISFKDTRSVPWPSSSKVLMANVARFELIDKGQDLLLETLSSSVWKERDFELHLYGDGPDKCRLKDLIGFYGLTDKVTLPGYEADIRKIWSGHHLFVLPSLSEGTPLTLIEAQVCGRPALVTRVDGNPDWVEDGVSGFIAEAPTVHHLSIALGRAWENRLHWQEMGRAAREKCLAKRDPDPAGTLLNMLAEAAESVG
jgi:glycosyltransferase involved in cell wall biosynthesis